MKTICFILAALAALALGGCGSMNPRENTPQLKVAKTANDIIKGESSFDYLVVPYPGTGKNYNPNRTISFAEHNDLANFNDYCYAQANKLKGSAEEMLKQGVTYGSFEGILGTLGMMWGFGSAISPSQYLPYIGMTGLGGGLASGKQTFELAKAVAHGYCMTGMVYKADEIDHKLKDIFIVPVYTGYAAMPKVSDESAPEYPEVNKIHQVLPPPPQ